MGSQARRPDLRFWMVREATEPYLVFIDGGAGRTATMFERLPQSAGHLTLHRVNDIHAETFSIEVNFLTGR